MVGRAVGRTGGRAAGRPALGVGFTVDVSVGLTTHPQAAQLAVEQAMQIAPECRDGHNVTRHSQVPAPGLGPFIL